MPTSSLYVGVQGARVQAHPRYQVLEKIASGSFATVYRGKDLELGREVAIKQIHEQYLDTPKQLDRYWQEAQLLASLQHPNIVTIYDIVRERGWLILELMQGNLSKIAGRKPMDLDSLRSTLAHCLRALRFLHAHGIVHGDLKPSNLMIDRRKRIKIGDFGLARRVSDDDGSLIKGTTKYMAPEVVTDEFGDVGPASDLYSLGFLAYELLCGENFESLFPGLSAFGRDKQIAWMMWHAAPDRRLPEIRRTLEGVPEDLAKVIQKLTAKPQAERYKSADEALSDLKIDLKLVGGDTSQDTTVAGGAAPDKKRRMILIGVFAASVLLSLAMLFMPGKSEPEAPKGITGLLRAVQADKRIIEIEHAETGYPDEVTVPPDVRFFLVDEERTVMLKDLQPGDRILPPRAGDDVRIARVHRPQQTHGVIKHIDVPHNEIELQVDQGSRRESIVLRTTKRSKLTLNGQPAELAALKLEDRLNVTQMRDPKQQASRVVIALDAKRTIRSVGFVVQADENRLVFEQRQGRTTDRVALPIAKDAPVTINGERSPGPNKAEYAVTDLKPGDRVEVQHDTHVTALEASRRQTLAGNIEDVDPEKGIVQVQTDDGMMHNFRVVEGECEISLAGDPVSIADLRRFDHVDVTYDPDGSVSPARTIDAVRRPRGERLALLIAVQNYADRNLTKPLYPLADAKLLQETLIKRYSYAPERILVLSDPTKADLERQVPEWLKKTTNQSQLLVLFAGNAYTAEDDAVYLAARDTQFADLPKTGVPLSWLAEQVDGAIASERILLFDASHAGMGPDLKKQFSAEELLKSLGTKDGTLLKQTHVVGSSSHGERGQDWTAKGYSLFGWAVADAFSMKADTNRNAMVDAGELIAHLKTTMTEAGKELPTGQTPVMFAP